MTINKARQILQDNGIQWRSYFCLCQIETEKEHIREAIEKIKNFIIRGTR